MRPTATSLASTVYVVSTHYKDAADNLLLPHKGITRPSAQLGLAAKVTEDGAAHPSQDGSRTHDPL